MESHKPLTTMSRLARIRKFRILAGAALDAYGFGDARFEFLALAGNALFRVYDAKPGNFEADDGPFIPGQYLLRIHDAAEQKTDAIALEMHWLSALRRDTGVPVPEPVPGPEGRLSLRVSSPGFPGERDCTLLRWLRGRRLVKGIRPRHYRAQGEVMARLHDHAAGFAVPDGFTKRRFDYDGLFHDDAGAGLPNRAAWASLSPRQRRIFTAVTSRVKEVMDDWGRPPEAYGLIHGDCGVDCNVIFHRGEARIIDFDGSGFGYYLYDLTLALEHCWDEPAYPHYRDALLTGYCAYRPLADRQLQYMDLFLAAFYVYMGLWTIALDKTHPDSQHSAARHTRWLEHGLKFIERHIDHL